MRFGLLPPGGMWYNTSRQAGQPARTERMKKTMQFRYVHNNINVLDLEKSLAFYRKALGLVEAKRTAAKDGSFILCYLEDGASGHQIELTWLRDRKEPYHLGDNEIHMAFVTPEFEKAHRLHEEMGAICFENPQMGIYFISDPDGYWIEIIPER